MEAKPKYTKIIKKIQRGLILSDLQFPNSNLRLLHVIEKYMAEKHWDYLIWLGDFMDMDAISHHAFEDADNKSLEGKRLQKDYDEAANILRRHRKIVGPKCKMYFFIGNHERWAEKFTNKYPTLSGMIEVEARLPLKELNIEVVPSHMHRKIGKMVFLHGDVQRGFVSANHAKKMVELYNRNVIYGHHHTFQAYTRISPSGIDETHTAYCVPCIANTSPKWNDNLPNAWLHGFATFEMSEERFTLQPIIAVHNGFVVEGKEYT